MVCSEGGHLSASRRKQVYMPPSFPWLKLKATVRLVEFGTGVIVGVLLVKLSKPHPVTASERKQCNNYGEFTNS